MRLNPLTRIRGCVLACTALLAVNAPAFAAPALQLTGGATEVVLSSQLLAALDSLGVEAGNVLPGGLNPTEQGATAAFPIPTGELDAAGPKLEIVHSGGLTLTAGDTRVALTTFIIENLSGNNLVLTGVVKANDTIVGRIPLFRVILLTAPAVEPPGGEDAGHLTVRKARLKLTDTAAAALNDAFGLDGVFTAGFPIGLASINASLRDYD